MLFLDGEVCVSPREVDRVVAVGQVGLTDLHASQVFDVLKVDVLGANVEHVDQVPEKHAVNQPGPRRVVCANENLKKS
jgi:hypothetical protein